MMCEWHENCEHPAVRRIALPHGFVWACKEAVKEYREMHGITTYVKFETSLTNKELRSLRLTGEEKRELEEIPRIERDEVLRRLLKSKKHKSTK